MNKKIMLFGAAALVGFLSLTAFGGKTKADQMAEISEKVKMGLDAFRADEKVKCDTKVGEAVAAKVAELAAMPVPAPVKGATKKATKGGKGGPKVDPLPQPSTPTNPKSDKMNPTPNTDQKQDKMVPAPNTDKKKSKMQGGGK